MIHNQGAPLVVHHLTVVRPVAGPVSKPVLERLAVHRLRRLGRIFGSKAVYKYRVFVPGVGHRLPPLLRCQLPALCRISGLDLSGGVEIGVIRGVPCVQPCRDGRISFRSGAVIFIKKLFPASLSGGLFNDIHPVQVSLLLILALCLPVQFIPGIIGPRIFQVDGVVWPFLAKLVFDLPQPCSRLSDSLSIFRPDGSLPRRPPIARTAPAGEALRRLDGVLDLMYQSILRRRTQGIVQCDGVGLRIVRPVCSVRQVCKAQFSSSQLGVILIQFVMADKIRELQRLLFLCPARSVPLVDQLAQLVLLFQCDGAVNELSLQFPEAGILRPVASVQVSPAAVLHAAVVDLEPPLSVSPGVPPSLPEDGLHGHALALHLLGSVQGFQVRPPGVLPAEAVASQHGDVLQALFLHDGVQCLVELFIADPAGGIVLPQSADLLSDFLPASLPLLVSLRRGRLRLRFRPCFLLPRRRLLPLFLRFSLPLRPLSGRRRLRCWGRRLLCALLLARLLGGPGLFQRPCIGIPCGREEGPLLCAAVSQPCQDSVDPVQDPLPQGRILPGQVQDLLLVGEKVLFHILRHDLLVDHLLGCQRNAVCRIQCLLLLPKLLQISAGPLDAVKHQGREVLVCVR